MNVSIVMATCNGERYLGEQLDSLRRQTMAPYELIVSDDDSSDGTYGIIQDFAATAPFPVRIFRNSPRLGFRENFLRAASQARGEWIAFCDQDDVWHPDKLRICAALPVTPDVGMIVHQAVLIDADGNFLRKYDQRISRTGVREPLYAQPWAIFTGFSMVFRRRVLDVIPYQDRFRNSDDEGMAHDRWVVFLAHTLGRTVEVAEPLVFYRQHDSNVFGVKPASIDLGPASQIELGIHQAAVRSRAMSSLIDRIPPWAEEAFPAFDRRRATEVYAFEAAHFEGRVSIYRSGRAKALLICVGMLLSGRYRNAHDRHLRWRSFLKDAFYIVAR